MRRKSAILLALVALSRVELARPAASGEADQDSARSQRVARFGRAQHTPQRLAVTRERLGALIGEAWVVLRLKDLKEVARLPRQGARSLVGLTGGSLLAAGAQGMRRLSRTHTAARAFPPAPLLGLATLLPDPHESQRLWMHSFGSSGVARLDLGAPRPFAALTGLLPVQRLVELPGFDTKAIVAPADGSLVYSTKRGLARRDINGVLWPQPEAELASGVWRLLAARRRDEVWVATGRRLLRVRVRPGGGVVERLALPPRVVAVAAQGGRIVALSLAPRSTPEEPPKLRFSQLRPKKEAATVDLSVPLGVDAFAELALAADPPWAFVLLHELWVVDSRTGVVARRLAPSGAAAPP